MQNNLDIRTATHRLLFQKKEEHEIPGMGSSAARIPSRHFRYKVTMNMDGDIVDYFKNKAEKEGRSYQLLINDVLREHIEGNRPEQLAKTVGEILLSDDSFIERLQEKLRGKS